MSLAADPVSLAQALIRAPSVTPDAGPALDVLEAALREIGFTTRRMPFAADGTAPVDNLYASIGSGAPHFCFAGHLDVVPPGDRALWSVDPFAGTVREGQLIGRGANDMKAAIAAFASAAALLVSQGPVRGTLSLLITGDEEGPAVNGTVRMLDTLAGEGVRFDHALVGEPTSVTRLGDMVKIGRRGSLTGRITVTGRQGHAAYPDRADNPIPRIVGLLQQLLALTLDSGTSHFQPSTLTITTVDVGNPASNVIPASARATFNIRFNDLHTPERLGAMLSGLVSATPGASLALEIGACPFLTAPGPFTDLVARAITGRTGEAPELSTTGGTSDARFITRHCPVVEFGLPGQTMHMADERVSVADVQMLSDIYGDILAGYFAAPGRVS